MARLVVNPGSPTAWEIQLKPGDNFIGRGFANDFKLTDPSVSSSHCQITVSDSSIVLKDLGSTNGTYVNRAPIREAALQTGQSVHLGGVEMVFYSDGPAPAVASAAPAVRMVGAPVRATVAPVAVPRPASAAAAPVALARPASVAAAPPPAIPIPPPPVPAAPPAAGAAVGQGKCKYHPKTAGRFFCGQCHVHYCELCVTTRNVGGAQHKFCRHCGAEVIPVQVQVARQTNEKSFFARLPGAFIYALRGSGLLMLIGGTIVLAAFEFLLGPVTIGSLRFGFHWGMIAMIFFYGYLFSYMQSIIHSTVAEEPELPPLPGMANFLEDILMPCLKLLGLSIICFGPAIALMFFLVSTEESGLAPGVIAALAFGVFYFPMAFLAVAILDNVMAANPLQVIPSILKAPIEYLVTLLLLGAVWGVSFLGDLVLPELFPRGLTTHSMAKLFGFLGVQAVWKIIGLYLLTTAMHILGLLYLTKKTKLGWLRH